MGSLILQVAFQILLAGLYRHCKQYDANSPNFMKRKHPGFQDLNDSLEVTFQDLRESGVAAMIKHAAVVSSEEEDTLSFKSYWRSQPYTSSESCILLCWEDLLS